MGRTLAAAIGIASIAAAAVASAEPPAGAASCSGCHPASTRVTSPVPRLAGLDRAAIVRAMQDFRSGQRAATVMEIGRASCRERGESAVGAGGLKDRTLLRAAEEGRAT